MILFKKNNENEEIRKLLGLSYFMQPEERLTYRLLLHYAFILHEDVTKISDEEIERARNISRAYFQNHRILPKDIDNELQEFINKEILRAIANINFDDLKNEIAKKVYNDLTMSNCIGNLKKASIIYYIDSNNYNSIIIKVSNKRKAAFYIYDIGMNTISKIKHNNLSLNRIDILERAIFNKKLLNNIDYNKIKIDFSPIEIGIDEYSI